MCLNLPSSKFRKLKKYLAFYKMWSFKYNFCNSVYSRCFKKFCVSANILLYIPLKIGNKVKKILSLFYLNHFLWSSKIYYFFAWCLLFFSNGHIHNVVSTLPNVMKIYFENDNIVLTLSNVVQINFEIDNVDFTSFNIVSFNAQVHNIVSLRCHINLKTTLKQRWNVCWDWIQNVFNP